MYFSEYIPVVKRHMTVNTFLGMKSLSRYLSQLHKGSEHYIRCYQSNNYCATLYFFKDRVISNGKCTELV